MKTIGHTTRRTQFVFFSLMFNLTIIMGSFAQGIYEEYTEREIVIADSTTAKSVKIKKGDRIEITLKNNSKIISRVLSINDSSLYIKRMEAPYQETKIPIKNILDLMVIHSYRERIYNVKTRLLDKVKVKGRLCQLHNSYMVILGSDSSFTKIPIEEIGIVRLRKRNTIGRGAAYGALSGALVGVILGLIAYDQDPYFTRGETVLVGVLYFAPIGTVIGGIIGSFSKKFEITGSTENYNNMKRSMDGLFVKGPLP